MDFLLQRRGGADVCGQEVHFILNDVVSIYRFLREVNANAID